MNIPQHGPNPQKAKFFRELAQALEFLAVFHTLESEQQLELMQIITKFQGQTK